MQYTDDQKYSLFQALLPYCHAEGAGIVTDPIGNIKNLADYSPSNMIIPIEMLAPEREQELRERLIQFYKPAEAEARYVQNIEELIASKTPQASELLQQVTTYIRTHEPSWKIKNAEHDAEELKRWPNHHIRSPHNVSTPSGQSYSWQDIVDITHSYNLSVILPSKSFRVMESDTFKWNYKNIQKHQIILDIFSATPLGKELQQQYEQESKPRLDRLASEAINEMRQKAAIMAEKSGHPTTPYMPTAGITKKKLKIAKLLAYNCTEEAELLHYKQHQHPGRWPILILDEAIPSKGLVGGKAAGQFDKVNTTIKICADQKKSSTFSKIPFQNRATYEEVLHCTDYILGKDYLHSQDYLSTNLADTKSIDRILDDSDWSRYFQSQDPSPPLGMNIVKWGTTRNEKKSRLLKTVTGNNDAASGVIAAMNDTICRETQLHSYKNAESFLNAEKPNAIDIDSMSTEIMVKTYANILTCRDQLERDGHSPDLEKLVKYVAYELPRHGGPAFIYTHARDEYLNNLRRENPDIAIAMPEPHPSTSPANNHSEIKKSYWKDVIADIKHRNSPGEHTR